MAEPARSGSSLFSWRTVKIVAFLALLGLMAAAAWWSWQEMRSSRWQASFISQRAQKATYAPEPGAAPPASLRYPIDGPFDARMGYSSLPQFLTMLQSQNFQITSQVRMSAVMTEWIDLGLYAPYREKDQSGLEILDWRQQPLFATHYPERIYAGFDDAPGILVKSLLFIENRELLDERYPTRNPAIDWGRFGKATLDYTLQGFGSQQKSAGGSTLATQIEKYRHSSQGRTSSLEEKLRQMTSATVRAYVSGEDTTAVRRQLVVAYLNTVPLSARPGYGEVNGMGDGLWVWYGRDFDQVNALLRDIDHIAPTKESALVYKQALSLMVAQRRPSYYLGGRGSNIKKKTDNHLRLLAGQGVISHALRDAALAARLSLASKVRAAPSAGSFVNAKATTAIRTQLLALLGVSSFYNLDRLDLRVASTLDGQTQKAVTGVLRGLRNPDAARAAALTGKGLLGRGDPAHVVYSFTLVERGEGINQLRVQTDNFDQPLDINDGAKLDLGSTAKLRTLVTYLDIIAALHQRLGPLDPAQRRETKVDPLDRLSLWALDYLANNPADDLPAMLQAALERRYSASPAESFQTGGGLHTFVNFSKDDNDKVLSVREGLRNSINLVFVRLMRDVVHHYMFQEPGSSTTLLQDADAPRRAAYLSRFADREGREFIHRFLKKYRGKSAQEAEELLLKKVRPTQARLASIFRTIAPEEGKDEFAAFLKKNLPGGQEMPADRLARLYEQYSPAQMSLADRGYTASVHPLELWVVGYLRLNPAATAAQVVSASSAERQEVYEWLKTTRHKQAQDKRIAQLIEIDGFRAIHRQWQRMGYPFSSLVPSYASSLGASADRPAALAELMGILVSDGVRQPLERIESLHFAATTPYETLLQHQPGKTEQVLPKEVAQAALGALRDVVDQGTARRVKGAFTRRDGSVLAVGGKTGTGDHRFDVYGARGQLLESRVAGRSATFVFNICERFFGSITAYVQGPQAANYDFTSALPVQLLKVLSPSLMPLIESAVGNATPANRSGP
ncbi:MAG: transglycosylase domain-containing protein [Gammaproteobacteria bacterium]|nr:transglycosylase domain-containing protein [Gammaproteobacteria bacterium]